MLMIFPRVYDPRASRQQVMDEYGITLIDYPHSNNYDAVILAVAHEQFSKLGASGIKAFCKESHVIFDVKYILPNAEIDGRL